MVVCFSCSPETKAKLDRLMELGSYDEYGEAIAAAVENALMLELEVRKGGGIVIEGATTAAKEVSAGDSRNTTDRRNTTDQRNRDTNKNNPVPSLFTLGNLSSPPLAQMPTAGQSENPETSIDQWVFGQYNKLLPAKASCRALAHLTEGNPNGVLVEEAATRISEAVVQLGDFLKDHDERNDLKRRNALSTAFPSSGKGTSKSRKRYENQFVARTNKGGQLSGLLFDYKLINQKSEGRILLTEPGWEFAQLHNPVLEGYQEDPTHKFGKEELRFLSHHIYNNVPIELSAFNTLFNMINEGYNTPREIDRALNSRITDDRKDTSESFRSSQRSGAISRMEDMGFIRRVRNGIHVSYEITDWGRTQLSNNN